MAGAIQFTTIMISLFVLATTFSLVQAVVLPNSMVSRSAINIGSTDGLDTKHLSLPSIKDRAKDFAGRDYDGDCVPDESWGWPTATITDVHAIIDNLNGMVDCTTPQNECNMIRRGSSHGSEVWICNGNTGVILCSQVVTLVNEILSTCFHESEGGGQVFSNDFNVIVRGYAAALDPILPLSDSRRALDAKESVRIPTKDSSLSKILNDRNPTNIDRQDSLPSGVTAPPVCIPGNPWGWHYASNDMHFVEAFSVIQQSQMCGGAAGVCSIIYSYEHRLYASSSGNAVWFCNSKSEYYQVDCALVVDMVSDIISKCGSPGGQIGGQEFNDGFNIVLVGSSAAWNKRDSLSESMPPDTFQALFDRPESGLVAKLPDHDSEALKKLMM